MRIWIMIPGVLGLLFGLTRSAPADIPPPLPPVKESTAFKIEVDDKAKGPKLILPNGVFTQPRVRPVPKRPTPTEPKGELPVEDGDGIASETPDQPRNHLLIAGVALTLSMTFGGLWFLRRKSPLSSRSLALLIAAGSSVAIGTLVWADIPVPPRKAPIKVPREKQPPLPTLLDTKVQVEFTYGNEPIRLIIDSDTLEKLKKDPKPPEAREPKPTAPPAPK